MKGVEHPGAEPFGQIARRVIAILAREIAADERADRQLQNEPENDDLPPHRLSPVVRWRGMVVPIVPAVRAEARERDRVVHRAQGAHLGGAIGGQDHAVTFDQAYPRP